MYGLGYVGASASAAPITDVWGGGTGGSSSGGSSGNASGGSGGGTTIVSGNTITYTPIADSYVRNDAPATNYGTAVALEIDGSPALMRPLLMFNVTNLSGKTVTSATLRLYVTNSAASGGNFSEVSNAWTETGVTWNNAPSPGATLDEPLHLHAGSTIDVNVTGSVTSDGIVSYTSTSLSADGAQVSSREGSNPPQLIITTS